MSVTTGAPLELAAGDAVATIHPARGGRVGSLVVGGRELLCDDPTPSTMLWGCYPMAPWAGRIRHGRFTFDEKVVHLPLTLPPHAIHGTVHDVAWDVVDASRDHCELRRALDWPFGGLAHQHIHVHPEGITLLLAVMATSHRMPAFIGWHPCLRAPARVSLRFVQMYRRDPDGITIAELVPPTAPPWDDCFRTPLEPITLIHPELEVTLESDCDHWVVFDEIPGILCVEPQSGPPDAFNIGGATVLEPGDVLQRRFTMSWRRRADGP
ncbi:MAG: aldose epimerase [Ilumatobacteraceae bacterium]